MRHCRIALLCLYTFVSAFACVQVSAQQLPQQFASVIKNKSPKDQVEAVDSLALSYKSSDPDQCIFLLKVAIKMSRDMNLDSLEVAERINLNRVYRFRSDNDSALAVLDTAVDIARKGRYDKIMVQAMAHRGIALTRLAEYDSASANYERAIKMAEELKDTSMVGRLHQQWGLVYFYTKDFNTAIEYTERALRIFTLSNDTMNMAANLDNLGLYYSNLENFDSAFAYQLRALPLFEILGDSTQIVVCYNNLGSTLIRSGRFDQAEPYLITGLGIARRLKDEYRVVTVLQTLGILYDTTLNDSKLQEVGLEGYELSVSIDNHYFAQAFAELLGSSFYRQKNFERAAFFFRESNHLRMLIYDEETASAAAAAAKKYQAVERKKQIELLEEANKTAAIKAERDELVKWAIIGVVIVLLIFSGYVVRNYYRKKRDNTLLQEQNEAIEEQKAIIEVKNEEITDSISYALRIQNAVLPTSEKLNALFPDNFIYYCPRDIISGDFYWAAEGRGGVRFLAVADCTGHGVPGAMMSMLGSSILNRLIVRKNMTSPGKILDALHGELLTTLNATKDTRQVNDGMDIAVLMFDPAKQEVVFASADRPVFIVKNGLLDVLRPDKVSIGSSLPKTSPYTDRVIPIDSGLSVYLYTDGITDQFGGTDKKKFMTKQLKDLVASTTRLSISERKELFTRTFDVWKAGMEQTDDMTLINIVIQ
jgi:serine phosphatase RsbU (regulator of sigma subunit)/tetratricopeptide (TPR) repeat protein